MPNGSEDPSAMDTDDPVPAPKPTKKPRASRGKKAAAAEEPEQSPEQQQEETNGMPALPPLLSVLDPSDVAPPKLPTKAEMEQVLLDLRKRALLQEYVGEDGAAA